MAFDAAIADGLLSRRRMGWSETAALAFAALALVLGAAAWISDSDQATALASAALPRDPVRISFDDRFSPLSTPESPPSDLSLPPLDRTALPAVGIKFPAARGHHAIPFMPRYCRTT